MQWLGKKQSPGFVGVPALDQMYTLAAVSLRQLELPPGSRVEVAHGTTALVHKRNALVSRFLAARPRLDWLLFLDSDSVCPSSTVRRLLKWDRDVVSGTYAYKGSGHARVVRWLGNENDHSPTDLPELVEVAAVGCGCLMVKRRVVEDLVQGPFWFRANPEDLEEDVHFCEAIRSAGGKIFLDTKLVIGHIGPRAFVPEDGESDQIMTEVRRARKDGISSLTINI